MKYKIWIFIGLFLLPLLSLGLYQSVRWMKVKKNNGKIVVLTSETSFDPKPTLLQSKLENYNPKEKSYSAKILTKKVEVAKSFPFTKVVEEKDTVYYSSPLWESL